MKSPKQDLINPRDNSFPYGWICLLLCLICPSSPSTGTQRESRRHKIMGVGVLASQSPFSHPEYWNQTPGQKDACTLFSPPPPIAALRHPLPSPPPPTLSSPGWESESLLHWSCPSGLLGHKRLHVHQDHFYLDICTFRMRSYLFFSG